MPSERVWWVKNSASISESSTGLPPVVMSSSEEAEVMSNQVPPESSDL